MKRSNLLLIFAISLISVINVGHNELMALSPIKPTLYTLTNPSSLSIASLRKDLGNSKKIILRADTLRQVEVNRIEIPQNYQTVSPASLNALITSSALMIYGISAHLFEPIRNIDYRVQELSQFHFPKNYRFDDFIQYIPLFTNILLDPLFCSGANHNIWGRVQTTAISYLLLSTTVLSLKYLTHIERPSGSAFNSFPSGHTGMAFCGAHLLYKEYKNSMPIVAISGYLIASTTGVMRVINNRHWISDVAMGAGLGILCTEIGYQLLPMINKNYRKKKNSSDKTSLHFLPIIQHNNKGISLTYIF